MSLGSGYGGRPSKAGPLDVLTPTGHEDAAFAVGSRSGARSRRPAAYCVYRQKPGHKLRASRHQRTPVCHNVGMTAPETPTQLRIGGLAAELGVNTKTIRYYESIGLLPQPKRTESGYRLYGPADTERLAFIRKARAVGLTLEEIGEMLALRGQGTQPCGHLRDLVHQKLRAVDEQLLALKDFREVLVMLEAETSDTACGGGQVCGVIEQHHLLHDLTDIPKRGRALSPGR